MGYPHHNPGPARGSIINTASVAGLVGSWGVGRTGGAGSRAGGRGTGPSWDRTRASTALAAAFVESADEQVRSVAGILNGQLVADMGGTGVLQIAAAVRLRKEIEGEWVLGLSGLISVLLGAAVLWFMLTAPEGSILALGWMLGLSAVLFGILMILLGLKLKQLRGAER